MSSELEQKLGDVLANVERKSVQSAGYRRHLISTPKSLCVLGGGTAGYFTALAVKRAYPSMQVELVEAPDVKIVGVGEASVDSLPKFLHNGLGIDVVDFYENVRPTWKLGIRFEWGPKEQSHFDAPFGWDVPGIGLLGALHYDGSINSMNLHSLLMANDKFPLFVDPTDNQVVSALKYIPHGYHLNNAPFVRYLSNRADEMGIVHTEGHVVDAEMAAQGDEPRVTGLKLRDGRRVEADIFVDCTGFRSVLLERQMGSSYLSFEKSLFNDRALAFVKPHGGLLKPYTTARTMNSGWAWTIPQESEDHGGYVFSSSFIDDDAAREEVLRTYPQARDFRTIPFQSGRHQQAWVGNVFAVGNSYGFVEPLESTGILMIQIHVERLVGLLGGGDFSLEARRSYNHEIGNLWDSLQSFLALHFRFNRRIDSPYWKEVQTTTDISQSEAILAAFRAGAPLSLRHPRDLDPYRSEFPLFYGLSGLDCILLGQKVPCNLLPPTCSEAAWRERKSKADNLVRNALSQAEGLNLLRENPELLRSHFQKNARYSL